MEWKGYVASSIFRSSISRYQGDPSGPALSTTNTPVDLRCRLWRDQRQYIIQQLKENEADLDAADQELDLVNSEQNYELFVHSLISSLPSFALLSEAQL